LHVSPGNTTEGARHRNKNNLNVLAQAGNKIRHSVRTAWLSGILKSNVRAAALLHRPVYTIVLKVITGILDHLLKNYLLFYCSSADCCEILEMQDI